MVPTIFQVWYQVLEIQVRKIHSLVIFQMSVSAHETAECCLLRVKTALAQCLA